ncbi:MAG: hypothetical protein JXA78_14375 [Anaerolineales bacterium]|nr:hypothetical protein [Anaerolineales bacterium]
MARKPILIVVIALAVVTLACSVSIDIPVDDVTAGPPQIMEFDVAEPDASIADLRLVFGAGELKVEPGAQGALVSGTAEYNVDDFKPRVSVDGEEVRIETGDLGLKGIPKFDDEIKNAWNIQLSDMPMRLAINAGAYEGDLELGGLALKSLEVSDGAADVRLEFSEPNPVEMETLRYTTGASNVKLSGLANANFASMIFRSGAGDYTLNFSGVLQRDAVATIESGISQLTLIVPQGTAARVIFKGGLTNISVSGEWSKSGDTYILEADGPLLTINVDMGAGNLDLRSE